MRVVFSILLSAIIAQAANVDAGSITKDIERQLETPKSLPKVTVPQIDTQEKQTSPSVIKVYVKAFKINGNTVVATSELENVLSVYLGKTLTFDELQDATRAIVEYYRTKGYSARAFLPPQEIQDGIVEIMIIEGKLSAIEIDTQTSKRLKGDMAKGIIETAHPIGKTLEIKKLEKGLLILGDTPGIRPASSLSAGESAGDSKLKVKLEDTAFVSGTINGSNTGSKSTGTNQLSLSSAINSPSSIGDQIVFQGMRTQGIDYGRLSYSLPLGYSGLRLGMNGSKMKYETVEGANADGKSKNIGFNLSYPILRSPNANLSVSLAYDKKSYLNKSAGTIISDKTNDVTTLSFNGNTYDSKGYNNYGISITRGNLDLTGLASDYQTDQNTAKTNGYYLKTVLNLARTQYLNDTLSLNISSTLQKSNKNLDSGERMYLGGSSGIRAYPNNEASGDEGWMINAELTKILPFGFNASLFYDIGEIKQHEELYSGWQGAGIDSNHYQLKGYGVSVGYGYGSWSAKATVAYKDGHNPNPQPNGSDNDGTKKEPRVWLSISKAF